MTLEQHGFEVRWLIYTQILFSGKQYSTAPSMLDWTCTSGILNGQEPCIGRVDYKLYGDRWLLRGWTPRTARGVCWVCVCPCTCAQSCSTLCNPLDGSLPGSTVHGGFPGKNTGAGCHFLLQGIFLTQGLNLGLLCLLHCRQILYCWLQSQTVRLSLSPVGLFATPWTLACRAPLSMGFSRDECWSGLPLPYSDSNSSSALYLLHNLQQVTACLHVSVYSFVKWRKVIVSASQHSFRDLTANK